MRSTSKENTTSAAVTGRPSENRAAGLSRKVTDLPSGAISMDWASFPYTENGSSSEFSVRVSKISPASRKGGRPFKVNGLSVSKLPGAETVSVPPWGAFGLAYSKWLNPFGYLRALPMASP